MWGEQSVVDVETAEAHYKHLSRTLTRESILKQSRTIQTNAAEEQEMEFNLKDFLQTAADSYKKEGIKGKRMGVTFRNLTVVGEGADATHISDLTTPFEVIGRWLNPLKWLTKSQRGTDFNILHDITGFVRDGEMLLVLGRPGSGCTTFLRVIANKRKEYKAVEGALAYGGVQADEFSHYRGESMYVMEEDVHYPTLTVSQTLKFALKTKTPGKRLPNQTRNMFVSNVLHMLGSMFGLNKAMNTLVGNEFVRGLSGGERKRLSIAEAMASRSAINCWDCSTRGLDAASALDYAKSLRVMSNTLNKTTIASFYQASDSIYYQFDKVVILDKGRCIFFGPVHRAKSYFEELGFVCPARKSTPDFLTGITNPHERVVAPGWEGKTPRTAAEFEQAFHASSDYKLLMEEMQQYERWIQETNPANEFRDHLREAKAKTLPKKSPYTTSYISETKALLIRQFQLIWGDKASLVSRAFSVTSKGLIYASVFYLMQLNGLGAFSRGGALFSVILFMSMISQSELPNALKGRTILQKHKAYAMYHPSSFHVAQVISDIPIAIMQSMVFTFCSYFMFGLDLRADKFFFYWFTLWAVAMCMTAYFRLCGAISKNYFLASQLSSTIWIIFLCYSGYLIPYSQMHPWLIWVYWINPMAYGYKALMGNEMRDQDFSCTGEEAIPYGPTYTQDNFKSCTFAGSKPGRLYIPGDDYLKASYNFTSGQMAVSIIAVLLFWVLFVACTALALEKIEFTRAGTTRSVYKKGMAPKKNDTEAEEKELKEQADEEKNGDKQSMNLNTNTTFTWQHINYTVPVKGGKRQLLDDIGGWIKPGEMTALMGSSGAGKTTLLDVLSKRKTIGEIEGRMYLNGEPLGIDFERITGYCEQMDVHNPAATVREALRFSAYLRQPPEVSKEEKDAYVEEILHLMEMEHIAEALIGDLESGAGISVEERKRLTIGIELVAKPKILFLDEPTSGLDAQSSYNIIKFVRKLADHGMPLVCTIHQPSSILFEYFDRLLLLARGGKTVYFGPIGENSRVMLDYFERNGAPPCPTEANPSEYILDCIGAGINGKAKADWIQLWKDSPEATAIQEELEEVQKNIKPQNPDAREFASGEWEQFKLVYKRMNKTWWRSPDYNVGRLAKVAVVGLLNGFSFWKLGDSVIDLQARINSIFQILVLGTSLVVLSQPKFIGERQWFKREYASKFYGWRPFGISIVLVEIPFMFICAALCMFCVYWTVGFQDNSDRQGYYYIMFVFFMCFCTSFGQMIAAASTSLTQASIFNSFLNSFLSLFSGLLMPPQGLPTFWRSWMYWIDPYHYFLEGLMVNELQDFKVNCKESDYVRFFAPSGQSCGSYAGEFLKVAPGYLANSNATDVCRYCPYTYGQDFTAPLGWSFEHRWRNAGLIIAFWCFNLCMAVILVWVFRKNAR
ncbi:ABC transporter G family protein [Basidiobolus meristosporus CBS 931.73]|uniref:ABC transporter G family protein n=1 Tax=Basidiobolus meristosporus CBS 931.73 TaxID=1314790 RepID=A0A1Y1YEI0_9FUNG|nr:ABC transporter G family protein [Basidiobolus meristosporus CBS 931.73]|eukprot:ORX95994.1 ABC transporter G family protein [Basidiobolus meristosporus CBS 931.73]